MPASRLRFVPDPPAQGPVLGFEDDADALAQAIANIEPVQLTIDIYGPWGSGKSSLLKAIGPA